MNEKVEKAMVEVTCMLTRVVLKYQIAVNRNSIYKM